MSTIEYYNKNARKYSETTKSADVSSLYEHFLPKIKKSGSILDLGCGSGRDSRFFKDKGYITTSVDGSEELCKLATDLVGQPVQHLLFSDLDYHEEFDAIWACASLLHVDKSEIRSVIMKVSEALKPSGYLYMSYKYGNTERNDGERSFSDYTEADIPWLLENSELKCVESWISQDVRTNRNSEKWLNMICQRIIN